MALRLGVVYGPLDHWYEIFDASGKSLGKVKVRRGRIIDATGGLVHWKGHWYKDLSMPWIAARSYTMCPPPTS